MPKPDIRLQLVEDAYRAAAGQIDWEHFTNHFSRFSTVKTCMVGHDDRFLEFNKSIWVNVDADYVDSFARHYYKISPWAGLVGALGELPHGGWCHHGVSLEQLQGTEFYEDWARPQGEMATGYGLSLVNEKNRHVSLLFNNSLSHMDEGQEIERVLLEIGDQIKRALELQRQLQGQQLRLNNYEHVLNQLHSAVIITDERGRTSFANRNAEALLRRGDVIRLDRSLDLKFIHSKNKQKVERNMMGLDEASKDLAPFLVSLDRPDGDQLTLFVSPIGFEPLEVRDLTSFWQAPRQFAWFFISLDQKPRSKMEIVMMAMQVSPAEAVLACSLLEDKSLQEYAEERQVSMHTARSQMRSLLGKTGCRRQAELVGKLNRLFSQING